MSDEWGGGTASKLKRQNGDSCALSISSSGNPSATQKTGAGAIPLPTSFSTQNTNLKDYTDCSITLSDVTTVYDILFCSDASLINQLAPDGTPVRNKSAKNDEAGWPTYKGGGCRCGGTGGTTGEGNICCTQDAEVAVLNSDGTIGTKGATAWFVDVPNTKGDSCTCNFPGIDY